MEVLIWSNYNSRLDFYVKWSLNGYSHQCIDLKSLPISVLQFWTVIYPKTFNPVISHVYKVWEKYSFFSAVKLAASRKLTFMEVLFTMWNQGTRGVGRFLKRISIGAIMCNFSLFFPFYFPLYIQDIIIKLNWH